MQCQPQWQLEFHHGKLQLNSNIHTLEELFMFGKAAIRYLSPFGHTFQTSFECNQSVHSFTMLAWKAMSQSQTDIQQHPFNKREKDTPPWNPPNSLIRPMDSKYMIPKLVDKYFACLDMIIPILHEPSFREHYSSLQNPLEDIITLAICTASSISTCQHAFLNTHERRYLGEYFYHLSIEKLIEIFDDPERQLETLITINLLQPFMVATLRSKEMQRWSNIALVISSTITPNNAQMYSKPLFDRDRAERIEHVLITRNIFMSNFSRFNIEFFLNFRRLDIKHFDIRFQALPDEPENTKMLFELTNHIMKLTLSYTVTKILTQLYAMATGNKGEISFEEIIQYQHDVNTWWLHTPDHLRIGSNLFGITQDLIQATTEVPKLLFTMVITSHTLALQSYIIQLVPKDKDQAMYRVIEENMFSSVLYLSDISLALLRRLAISNACCYSPKFMLLLIIDSLVTLSQVKKQDQKAAHLIKARIDLYMNELKLKTSPDHQVTPSTSPYSIVSIAPSNTLPSATELYKHYPLPFEALSFDLIQAATSKAMKSYHVLNPIL
ncbi:uncharacterized protein B0P05DRAFT_63902 [Gilbertella persicaria]|nr:uncharacterized protein B0P05DRAFT_63902 [Gilbertella persicaria]KAI8081859.1 hypothetical protein B0P05DRAFT_63902 [Gilbertella persicaria]